MGTKRIGLARADQKAKIPEPLKEISVDGNEFSVIAELVEEHNAKSLVIGMPRNSSGHETAESARVRLAVEKMKEYLYDLDVEVVFQDESLTSIAADEVQSNTSDMYRNASRDSLAAAVILKEYLNKL